MKGLFIAKASLLAISRESSSCSACSILFEQCDHLLVNFQSLSLFDHLFHLVKSGILRHILQSEVHIRRLLIPVERVALLSLNSRGDYEVKVAVL